MDEAILATIIHKSAVKSLRRPILTHPSSPSESMTITSPILTPFDDPSRATFFESSSGVTLDRSCVHAGGEDVGSGSGPGSDIKVGDSAGIDAEDPLVDVGF